MKIDPAIVQDVYSDEVLMLAYMNGESLAKTVETGYTWFWSRSRQELWNKGATSGHMQKVESITYDCDGDALLVKVDQTGAACHTGHRSCFFNPLWNEGEGRNLPVPEPDNESIYGVLAELYRVILYKREHGGEKSYTRYLFMKGQDKILKKVGEESAVPVHERAGQDFKEGRRRVGGDYHRFQEQQPPGSDLRNERPVVSLHGIAGVPRHYSGRTAS